MAKRILISGAGIAGGTLAYWLQRFGFEPILVELAPQLRTGGYMIDFWGAGFRVAEKMQIIDQLREKHYTIPELEFVNKDNKRIGAFPAEAMRRAVQYRHCNLLRSSLAEVIFHALPKTVPIHFGTSVTAMEETPDGVHVTLSTGETLTVDLVVGADGLHSNVRTLLFHKDENAFERFMGYYLASFTIDNYIGEDHIFRSYSERGKQVGIYSLRDGKLAVFFAYEAPRTPFDFRNRQEQQERLQAAFARVPWKECPTLFQKMQDAPDFYYDEVTQIVLPHWSQGRVALVGDAAHCASLLSGQGSALAMTSAYILAGELKKNQGDYAKAFRAYEHSVRPEIERKQHLAQRFAGSFIPKTRLGLWGRNVMARLMLLPIVSKLFVNAFLSDKITLPDYESAT